MCAKLLGFEGINFTKESKSIEEIQNITKRDIAIIGIYARISDAEDVNQFWENLVNGKDCIKDFPEERKPDVIRYLQSLGIDGDSPNLEYLPGGYMKDIDKFDYSLFSISPREASLMDPHQRLFLEAAWAAIEDSGYGGKKLSGSKTGVFLGFSADFGEEYKRIVRTMEPTAATIATTGNIKSVTASRISYILDLKGPSMLIDTACSSSLVAVHQACKSIRNGECDYAIAGGVKVHLAPINGNHMASVGMQIVNDIISSESMTKTFDDSSDGTMIGEGVAAVVLKPLHKALSDNDHIYAVIKGSAINQDGSSVGITAPNAAAQEDVICAAWKDAGIDPETISYIEAHGTGTKLGDPVEISGIQRAFRRYTERKQFCSIGSVKSNIGHLDSAAGIAGLIKAVKCLYHKELPASLHFQRPNRKIPFEDSPVYVNESFSQWETDGNPARCGVSSFGLSGTNCHIVLEEAPSRPTREDNMHQEGYQVLTLSAMSQSGVKELIDRYRRFLEKDAVPDLADICFTANTGRGHYSHRLAIIAKDCDQLRQSLERLLAEDWDQLSLQDIYYGEHRVVPLKRGTSRSHDITEDEKRQLSLEADLALLEVINGGVQETLLPHVCQLYIQGAEIRWELLYKRQSRQKISLPVYPFAKNRCWVGQESANPLDRIGLNRSFGHPLVDVCLAKSKDIEIYSTHFSINDKQWALREHKVTDQYVLPGTAYIEMIRAIVSNSPDQVIELKKIMFLSPLMLSEGEEREVHIILKRSDDETEFVVTSKERDSEQWIVHVEGLVSSGTKTGFGRLEIAELKRKFAQADQIQYTPEMVRKVKVGPRWDNFKQICRTDTEHLILLELQEEYWSDLREYQLHPALMDCAVNAANLSVGNGLYLPFSYKRLLLSGPTPETFYSYIRRKDYHKQSEETAVFDIILLDETGAVFAEVEDYVIKRVRMEELRGREPSDQHLFHEVVWFPQELDSYSQKTERGRILVLKGEKALSQSLIGMLRERGNQVVEVVQGEEFQKLDSHSYAIANRQEDFDRLIREAGGNGFSQIIHMFALDETGAERSAAEIEETIEFEESADRGLLSLFYLTKAMVNQKLPGNTDLVLITQWAKLVTGKETTIKPLHAAMIGLGSTIGQEYAHIRCRAIDVDETIQAETLLRELSLDLTDLTDSTGMAAAPSFLAAYRENKRYVEAFRQAKLAERKNEMSPREELSIKEDGVYLITGGLGALGLEIGKHLASLGKVKLALLSRNPLPERKDWPLVENDKLKAKIEAIRQMEALGAQVEWYGADVSRLDEMKPVLDELRAKHGKINGIIHCAGIAGEGFLFRKDEPKFRRVIDPKIKGTWVIDQLTQTDDLDFLVLFSSVNAVVGVAGQGDYSAANHYLDAFADQSFLLGKKVISINWTAWKEVGMAVEHHADWSKSPFRAISNRQALDAFRQVLNSQLHRVIVGGLQDEQTNLLAKRYVFQVDRDFRGEISQRPQSGNQETRTTSGTNGISITGKGESDLSEIERKMAKIWAKMLGLHTIDIYDSFYNLGGDSLLAAGLLKEIEAAFPNTVDITDIFTYPTVYDLSAYIKERTGQKKQKEQLSHDRYTMSDIVAMLAKNEITPEEADRLMKQLEETEVWL